MDWVKRKETRRRCCQEHSDVATHLSRRSENKQPPVQIPPNLVESNQFGRVSLPLALSHSCSLHLLQFLHS